jgi:hypothetical protein
VTRTGARIGFWVFQRTHLDVAEENFGALGLEEDYAAGRKGVDSFVGQFAVHVLPHVPASVHKFDNIPLPVRRFQFIGRVAKGGHIFEFALVEAVDLGHFSFGSGDALAGLSVWANRSQRCAICHPEIAGVAFVYLKLDRARPNFIETLNVVENAAVAGLALPRNKCSLAPFEFGAQIVILVLMFSDEVTEFGSRHMHDAIFHREDMVVIRVQANTVQECIELIQILCQSDAPAAWWETSGTKGRSAGKRSLMPWSYRVTVENIGPWPIKDFHQAGIK